METIETIGRGFFDQSTLWYHIRRAIGRPILPPHAVKERLLIGHAAGISVLVETGTYLGHMVSAMQDQFERIYSIELAPELARKATARFATNHSITILHGDSGTLLPEILDGIAQPCVFWLDGHYSGGATAMGETETPVLAELRAILRHPYRNVILIDDARLFTGTRTYPTVDELRAMLTGTGYRLTVSDDVIQIK